MKGNSHLSGVGPRRVARGAEVLVGADERSVAAVTVAAAPGQRPDEVADPERGVEAGGGRAVHQVRRPPARRPEALARVELGAVAGVRHQVVGRVLGHLGADPVVG